MKAAVLNKLGKTPVFDDFKDPQVTSDSYCLMNVKASALKNLDRLMTRREFYAHYEELPAVVGTDAVGVLENGTRVYARGAGTFAEKMLVRRADAVNLPEGLDWAAAAAIPNAALGSYLPLKVKGEIKKGDVVLINGGTGITGKFAIQLARHYGASRIIVSGRVQGREEELTELGADELISTEGNPSLASAINEQNEKFGIDLVLDYLWGEAAEIILQSLSQGQGATEKPVRFINIGNVVSPHVNLHSNVIRSSKLEILGSGLGSYSKNEFQDFYQNVLPGIFQLAVEEIVHIGVHKEKLEDIGSFWNQDVKGKRTVVMIG